MGAAPVITEMGLIGSQATREPLVLTIKGVDHTLEPSVTDIRRGMLTGSLDALGVVTEDGPPPILLGKVLAEKTRRQNRRSR